MPDRGWWFEEAGGVDPGPPCPPLRGDVTADVLVLGGGYTGMWTAWFLTERRPGIDVVLLEADVCGGGPSGRNGGFLTGWWDELPSMVEMFGPEGAVAACRAVGGSVRAIGEWCEAQGVDAWFTPGGYLEVAATPLHEGAWDGAVKLAADLGCADEYVPLSPGEVAARCRSAAFGPGVLMRDGATVQPARLARGLRRVLLERGVRIHEGSPALGFRGGSRPAARTPEGTATADQAVLAVNAWAARWPSFRGRLLTWGSHIVLTAPAPERLAEIGWTGGECITDSRTAVHYFRTTPDGRIAFGGGGGRASRKLGPALDFDGPSIRRAEEGLRRMFPSFADVPVERAWGGPIDVSPTHLPTFGSLAGGHVHHGFGYSGNGVAPAHLGGRILASLVLGEEDDLTALPIVNPSRVRRFPPEPVRSIGAGMVRRAVIRAERAEDRGRRVSWPIRLVATMPRRLGYHVGPERRRRTGRSRATAEERIRIEGRRVTLRPLRPEEFDAMWRSRLADDETVLPQGMPPAEQLRARIEASGVLSGHRLDLAIEVEGLLAGEIQAFDPPDRELPPDAFEVGIALYDPADRGWGLGTEAMALLVDWLFEARGATRVSSPTHETNAAMRAVLERLGFSPAGTARAGRVEFILYAIERERWLREREEPPEGPSG
ncbi:MAG: FAD-dependent oxidoreductase [Actinobacteria bacterium]|nr:FAD-dependent oxidoreductase [Actinomycetota bacterium]